MNADRFMNVERTLGFMNTVCQLGKVGTKDGAHDT